MSKYGDKDERDMPPVYNKGSRAPKKNTGSDDKIVGSDDSDTGSDSKSDSSDDTGTDSSDDTGTDSSDEKETENDTAGCKTWLEVLPSKGGILLAALLTEIMTEGLTPTQVNILGSFIGSVGTLMAYKAARDALDYPPEPF